METKRDSFFVSKNKTEKNGRHNETKSDIKDKRQDQFNKNRDITIKKQETDKKPFDKKAYRLKKYSKKYKLEQWEEQRKKKLLRNYYKDVKTDPVAGSYKPKSFDEDTTDSNDIGRFVRHPDFVEKEDVVTKTKQKNDSFQKAKKHYDKIKNEKLEKQQEIERTKAEKQQKLQEYKKKKQERFKKLSKKTKKGQPVMTGRLELLLEKIQRGSN